MNEQARRILGNNQKASKPQGSVESIILELLWTIYGTVQAAMAFFRELLKAFEFLKYKRSKANPCLHYKWSKEGKFIIWLS